MNMNQIVSFQDKLNYFIARYCESEKQKPSRIYKNLHGAMSRQTFSKLRSKSRHPDKLNIFLLAVGMKLSLSDTECLLLCSGEHFCTDERIDMLFKECIRNENYNIFSIDEQYYQITRKSLVAREDDTNLKM